MEAFPAITLVSADTVLHAAIPAQLKHVHGVDCAVTDTLAAAFTGAPPALLLLDCAVADFAGTAPAALRHDHPLVALLAIGTETQRHLFADIPLAAFLPRPVAMPELLRQLEQLVYDRTLRAGEQRLPLPDGVAFQPAARRLTGTDGHETELTDKESAILACLYHHRHGGLSRQQLLEEVWGYGDSITTHTLETHLYRLRAKLREVFGEQDIIVTRNGRYHLRP